MVGQLLGALEVGLVYGTRVFFFSSTIFSHQPMLELEWWTVVLNIKKKKNT